MRRRSFLALAGAAGAFPQAALSQSVRGRTLAVIAFLTNETEQQSDLQSIGPFRRALNDLGLRPGNDYVIEARYGRGDSTKLTTLAKELVGLAPELVIASDSNSAAAAIGATATIPVIGQFGSDDPTLNDRIGNWAKPAGNLTGIATNQAVLSGKHVELALDLVPTARRIGVLVYTLNPERAKATRENTLSAAAAHKVELTMVDVAQPTEMEAAFKALATQGADTIVVGSGTVFAGDRPRSVQAAATTRLPVIWNEQGYVDAGGLISYGFSREATHVRLATFAQLVLRAVPISQIPVEETATYFMAINLRTAKALGLVIPPTVLFRADQVIE